MITNSQIHSRYQTAKASAAIRPAIGTNESFLFKPSIIATLKQSKTATFKHAIIVAPLATLLLLVILIIKPNSALAIDESIQLPELGDSVSSAISLNQEKTLGQAWLALFRRQVETTYDPILTDYTEHLLYQLASHSELKTKELAFVMVNNPTINAFAVPGGVIGLHNGLFLHAQTEDQLSAVLAHEIAHLSQRHYARSLEDAKRQSIPTLAAILASVVLAATAGGDAGMAAFTATQAIAIDSRLRFTRYREQEADRIGMQTLTKSGRDPHAVAQMFQQMLKANRFYGNQAYEFLQTHPLTESRVIDATNRAKKYAKPVSVNSLLINPNSTKELHAKSEKASLYHFMQVRVDLSFQDNPLTAVRKYREKTQQSNTLIHRYGLVLALTQASKTDEAITEVNKLLSVEPENILFLIAKAQALADKKYYSKAISILAKALAKNPNNYPISLSLANIYHLAGQANNAKVILTAQSKIRPNDPDVWYLLAEVNGLADDIAGVHEARAEYFILIGAYSDARKQLTYGLNLVRGNFQETERLKSRILDVNQLEQSMDQLSKR